MAFCQAGQSTRASRAIADSAIFRWKTWLPGHTSDILIFHEVRVIFPVACWLENPSVPDVAYHILPTVACWFNCSEWNLNQVAFDHINTCTTSKLACGSFKNRLNLLVDHLAATWPLYCTSFAVVTLRYVWKTCIFVLLLIQFLVCINLCQKLWWPV